MSNVIAINGGGIPGEPDAEIITEIESILALAKSGAITGFAYAVTKPDMVFSTGWVGIAGTRNDLMASVMLLSHRLAAAVHQQNTA